MDKLRFRRNLALKASITKLNYYAKMLQKVFGSAQIPLPENYSDKLKQLQKQSAVAGVKRGASNKSLFSMVSRTNMSSKKSFISDAKSEIEQTEALSALDEAMDDEDDTLQKKKGNPVMDGLKVCFEDISGEIQQYT